MGTDHYYKSLDVVGDQLQLSTIKDGEKTTSQTLSEILTSSTIIPNTVHPSFPKRLCVNYILAHFALASYRPNGLLFESAEQPDYACPVDIMKLTEDPENLTAANDSPFLEGYEQFLYPTIDAMVDVVGGSPVRAGILINEWRVAQGKSKIDHSYNECAFFRTIKVKPLALYGLDTKDIAAEFNLDYYPYVADMCRALLGTDRYWRKPAEE